jgi:hypothetical protein
MLEYLLLYTPAAVIAGMVMGFAGSRELKRGALRGLLNSGLLVAGLAALIFVVQISTDPTLLGG